MISPSDLSPVPGTVPNGSAMAAEGDSCRWCASARKPVQGPYVGSCWCVMKRKPVNPLTVAWCFSPNNDLGDFNPHPLKH